MARSVHSLLVFDEHEVYLSGDAVVQDSGTTVVVTGRPGSPRIALDFRSTIKFLDGRSWFLVDIVRHLAALPREERAPLAGFPPVGAEIEELLLTLGLH